MEWLVLWGVQKFSGFAFKPVLEFLADQLGDLAQEAGKDFVKDFFKDSLKSGVERFKQKELAKAMGQAYTQFLYLVQQELEAEDVSKQEIEAYNQPLIKFIGEKSVKQYLGKAFEPGCQSLDLRVLATQWNNLELKSFPDDFNWKRISRLYLKRVENIIGESQDLKDLFTARKTGEIAENSKQIAGIIPDYDLQRYRESIQETYRHLKLGKLDSTYRNKSYEVKLWKIFIPQTVRKGLPSSVDEYPKETQEKLQEQGLLVFEQTQQTKSCRSVLEVIADPDYPYLVFVGNPGSGKSTLLQYLALDWAENPTERLPLLIELREYAKDENKPRDFLAFFHEGKRNICELNQLKLDEQLNSGKALVMFDGLDEIFNNDLRGRVITEIHKFSNKYPQTKIIVTSRRIGYDPEYLENAEFQHFNLIDPFNSGNYNELAMIYDYLGEYDAAIENYHQGIKLDPKNNSTYNNLGCLYRSRKQWEDAINAFNTAIELNPLNSSAYRNLGLLYLLQNNLIEAEQAFLTAIKVNSYYGDAVLNIGILKALQGNLEDAKTNWQTGLKLYPEYAQDARLFRTLYMIALGEIESGLTTLQQILNQEKPPVGLLRYVMETAHLLQGCPQLTGINEAVTMIEKAISTHPLPKPFP